MKTVEAILYLSLLTAIGLLGCDSDDDDGGAGGAMSGGSGAGGAAAGGSGGGGMAAGGINGDGGAATGGTDDRGGPCGGPLPGCVTECTMDDDCEAGQLCVQVEICGCFDSDNDDAQRDYDAYCRDDCRMNPDVCEGDAVCGEDGRCQSSGDGDG